VSEIESLVTDFKSPELVQPRDGTLDDPARLAQAAAMRGAPLGQYRRNAQRAQVAAVGGRVVGAIALDTSGALPGVPALAGKRRDGSDERGELGYIIGIGRRERRREGDAPGVADEVVFAARFAPIGWVGTSFFPPCMARTDELSTIARDHSICEAACSRVSNTRCICAHTPARCHAMRRRQQLTPEPQPISSGSAVHGIPVRSTNRMPVSACRWDIGLRPGCTRRRRFALGSSGSTICHKASSRMGLGMNFPRHGEPIHVEKYRNTHKSTSPIHLITMSF
jgi:hypothetical protein